MIENYINTTKKRHIQKENKHKKEIYIEKKYIWKKDIKTCAGGGFI